MTKIYTRKFAATPGADVKQVAEKTIFELFRDAQSPRKSKDCHPSVNIIDDLKFKIEGSAKISDSGILRGSITIYIDEPNQP